MNGWIHIFTTAVAAAVIVAYKEKIFPISVSVTKGHFELTLKRLSIER